MEETPQGRPTEELVVQAAERLRNYQDASFNLGEDHESTILAKKLFEEKTEAWSDADLIEVNERSDTLRAAIEEADDTRRESLGELPESIPPSNEVHAETINLMGEKVDRLFGVPKGANDE